MDSTSALLDSIEDLLLCPICTSTLKDAIILTCGHTICHNCIEQHLTYPNGKKCPMCSHNRFLFVLITNFTVENISETVRTLRGNVTRTALRKIFSIVVLIANIVLAGILFIYARVICPLYSIFPFVEDFQPFKARGPPMPRFVLETKKLLSLVMDSKRVMLSYIEEILRCSKCHSTLQDARVLGCGHTVCYGCAQRCKQVEWHLCPLCNESIGGCWSTFQKNYIAEDVSELVRAQRKPGEGSTMENTYNCIHGIVVYILSIVLAVVWLTCVCFSIIVVVVISTIIAAVAVFSIPFICFGNCILFVLSIAIAGLLEIVVFVREQHWYRASSYHLAKTMTVLPIQMILVICGGIVYWMTNQPNEPFHFVGFLSLATMTERTLHSLSDIMYRATNYMDPEGFQEFAAYMYLDPVKIPPFSVSPILLFVGFFVNLNTMSHILQLFFYTSYVRGELVCDRDDWMDYLFKVLDVQDAKFHFGFIIFCLLFFNVLGIAFLFIRRCYVRILLATVAPQPVLFQGRDQQSSYQ